MLNSVVKSKHKTQRVAKNEITNRLMVEDWRQCERNSNVKPEHADLRINKNSGWIQ